MRSHPALLSALPPTMVIPRKRDTYIRLVCYPLGQLSEHHLVHLRNSSFFTCGLGERLTAVACSRRDCFFVVTKVRFMRSHIHSFTWSIAITRHTLPASDPTRLLRIPIGACQQEGSRRNPLFRRSRKYGDRNDTTETARAMEIKWKCTGIGDDRDRSRLCRW